MITLFHSGTFSNRISKTIVPSSPLATRTVPGTGFKQDKENGIGKKMNNSVARRDTHFSPSLLIDYTLFSYILAVDAVLTAEVFLRDRLGTKKSISA